MSLKKGTRIFEKNKANEQLSCFVKAAVIRVACRLEIQYPPSALKQDHNMYIISDLSPYWCYPCINDPGWLRSPL